MFRGPVGKNDSAIFKRTASSGKKVNLGLISYRGGIRF